MSSTYCSCCEVERATDTLNVGDMSIELCDNCYWTKYHKDDSDEESSV